MDLLNHMKYSYDFKKYSLLQFQESCLPSNIIHIFPRAQLIAVLGRGSSELKHLFDSENAVMDS